MKVNIIAAVSSNGVIGCNGSLPWNIQEDLKRFKELTLGHAVIMGRLTWESLPIKPLPDRYNVVVSSNTKYIAYQANMNCIDLKDALSICDVVSYENVFIIGGTRLYQESLDLGIVDSMYITHIHREYEGDTYFPDIDFSQWKEVEREDFEVFSFVKYYRVHHA